MVTPGVLRADSAGSPMGHSTSSAITQDSGLRFRHLGRNALQGSAGAQASLSTWGSSPGLAQVTWLRNIPLTPTSTPGRISNLPSHGLTELLAPTAPSPLKPPLLALPPHPSSLAPIPHTPGVITDPRSLFHL